MKLIRVPTSFQSQIWSAGGLAAGAGSVFWNQSMVSPTPASEKCSHGWVTRGLVSRLAVPVLYFMTHHRAPKAEVASAATVTSSAP